MSNRAAVLTGVQSIRIEDRPTPTPGPGEVLVKVLAVGICGSDVHYYDHGRIGTFVVEQPMIIGHEPAGEIVGVGAGVDESRVGQLVALEPGIPCRHCEQCKHGRYNLCPDVVFFATPPVDGAIATFVTHPADFAHLAPAGLSAEAAAMAEPVSVGVWASRKAGVSPGDRVLVTGAGPIGLLSGQVARSFGGEVSITDISEFRLGVAEQLGLNVIPADAELPGEFEALIECSGATPAINRALPHVARAGHIVLVGMGADTIGFDVPTIQTKELSLTGTFRYANTYPTALELIASGAVDVGPVITHRFGMAETEAAMTLAHRVSDSLKAVVLPQK
jgi:L-iditol 2-dehydrogenase